MITFPLLVRTKPITSRVSPVIRVRPGSWRVVFESVKDSIVHVFLNNELIQKEFHIDTGKYVHAVIVEAGTEDYISILVQQI